MGKKKGSTGRTGINKSKEIRDAFQQLGIDTAPKEIQEYLRTHKGIEIKAQQISNQKNKLRQEATTITKPMRVQRSKTSPTSIPAVDLQKVANFVDHVGGIAQAKHALEIFQSLH